MYKKYFRLCTIKSIKQICYIDHVVILEYSQIMLHNTLIICTDIEMFYL